MVSEYIDVSTNFAKTVGIPGTAVNRTFEAAGGTSQKTAALSADTMHVLVATTDVRLAFGADPTASSSTMLYPGMVPLWFKTPHEATGTYKVAALSQDATIGSIVITPLAGDRV